ncbi:MAG: hypothetical protein KF752_13625 [Pirellulaceae bacterium]|nr:hypothetical protein [Pirellulaceae bacterium]
MMLRPVVGMTAIAQLTVMWLAVVSIWLLAGLTASAEQPGASVDMERALRAIRGAWYDRQSGQYRPPRVGSSHDNALRYQGRVQEPSQGESWLLDLFRALFGNRLLSQIASVALVLLLVAVLVLLVLYWYRSSGGVSLARSARLGPGVSIDPSRVAELPFEVQRQWADPRAEARRLADAGDFNQAMVLLYGYLLLALDQSRYIHLQRGKTNGMYLNELPAIADLQSVVRATMSKFEQVYFGRRALSSVEFEESWEQVEQIHQLLSQAPRQATIPGMTSHPPSAADWKPGVLARVLWVAALGSLAGCGASERSQEYGAVEGLKQYGSRNGLGVHRKLWESQGAKCIPIRRLSERLENVDVIVLVARDFDPPGREARRWLERWLSQAPGRSVIYFGRDFNADLYYWKQTRSQQDVVKLPIVDKVIAELAAVEIEKRIDSYTENTFCEWFYLKCDSPESDLTPQSGAWAGDITAPLHWPLRTRLLPPSRKYRRSLPSWISTPATSPPSNPLNSLGPQDKDGLIVRSVWSQDELATSEMWLDAFEQPLTPEILLQSEQRVPLVFRLTHRQRLGTGQIIVVANGAPMLNGSVVQPGFAQVAQQIVQQCLPARRVGLLAYDRLGILISNAAEADERGAGFEMFTQWPLSAITMSAALLGLVAAAWLLPILGRPRELREASTSDFSLHVEALGKMLHQTGDQQFARQAIAEYFRQVRREQPPPWTTPAGKSPDAG